MYYYIIMDVSVIILDLCGCMKYGCEYYCITLDPCGCMVYRCEYYCIKSMWLYKVWM